MAIPKHNQLHPGGFVSIVLKADQRTGKLTAGRIADVLTRGDHPRGVKVRLTDGQIGRVQSLVSKNLPTANNDRLSEASLTANKTSDFYQKKTQQQPKNIQTMIDSDLPPATSLGDYIKSSRAPVSWAGPKAVDAQASLEAKFPNLDSSLIAAILIDHEHVNEVEKILTSLSTE
ncbi:MAG: hypothetical protein Q9219_006951 [cf. Caloplaca sp. 3 TL-2023]